VGAELFRQQPNFLADLQKILKISWQHWLLNMNLRDTTGTERRNDGTGISELD
jgi:hypothetical protein